jgi:RHS repeat-associated protein
VFPLPDPKIYKIYYYGARYYDPVLGRFISADSIVPDFSNPQSLNRYSYVLNNPLRYIDPTGHNEADGTGEAMDTGWTNYGESDTSEENPLTYVAQVVLDPDEVVWDWTTGYRPGSPNWEVIEQEKKQRAQEEAQRAKTSFEVIKEGVKAGVVGGVTSMFGGTAGLIADVTLTTILELAFPHEAEGNRQGNQERNLGDGESW